MKKGTPPEKRALCSEITSARALGLAVAVNGFDHGGDVLRRGELGDAVAQVEHVAVAVGRLAVGVEYFMHFGADLLRAGEQDGRVQVALQADLVADQLARLSQVDGP